MPSDISSDATRGVKAWGGGRKKGGERMILPKEFFSVEKLEIWEVKCVVLLTLKFIVQRFLCQTTYR